MAENITNPFAAIDHRLSSIESKLDELLLKEKTTPVKRYYSIKDAASKLNVASITLYRGVGSGKIPSRKIGTRLMIPSSFVDIT